MRYHTSWPEKAQDAFEKIIASHGGWNAWDHLDQIDFDIEKMSGFLMWVKGLNRTFFKPQRMTVFPKEQRAQFHYLNHRDEYFNGKVQLGSPTVGHYNSFKKSTFEKWTPWHGTYFFGYAWCNYLSYPFSMAQHKLVNYTLNSSSSQFVIEFPEDKITHSHRQTFYFNEKHLLHRHDYRARIAGPFVYGAHCTEGYVEYKGIKFPRVRKVWPRFGPLTLPVYGIYGKMKFV